MMILMTKYRNPRTTSALKRTVAFSAISFSTFAIASVAGSVVHAGPVGACQTNQCLVGIDSDGDGFSDAEELAAGTDPFNAASHPATLNTFETFAPDALLPGTELPQEFVMPETLPNGDAFVPLGAGFPTKADPMKANGLTSPMLGSVDLSNGLRDALDMHDAGLGLGAGGPPTMTNGFNLEEISGGKAPKKDGGSVLTESGSVEKTQDFNFHGFRSETWVARDRNGNWEQTIRVETSGDEVTVQDCDSAGYACTTNESETKRVQAQYDKVKEEQRAAKEKADKEKLAKDEKAAKEKADKEKAAKEKADKEKKKYSDPNYDEGAKGSTAATDAALKVRVGGHTNQGDTGLHPIVGVGPTPQELADPNPGVADPQDPKDDARFFVFEVQLMPTGKFATGDGVNPNDSLPEITPTVKFMGRSAALPI